MDVIFTNLPLASQVVTSRRLSVEGLIMTLWQRRSNIFFCSDIFGGLSTECLLSPSASDPHATHSVHESLHPSVTPWGSRWKRWLAEVLAVALVLQEESPC